MGDFNINGTSIVSTLASLKIILKELTEGKYLAAAKDVRLLIQSMEDYLKEQMESDLID